MPGLTDQHYAALHVILQRTQPHPDLVWALTGSTSFSLQGMDVEPHDIDIMTDEAGAYLLGDLLAPWCAKPVTQSQAPYIRSHYGTFLIEGVEVEVMGASRRLGLDGTWGEPWDLKPRRYFLTARGLVLPVIHLRHEVQAYQELRRPDRARQIEQFLWNGSE